MDFLYSILCLATASLIPFVCYFLVFKKNGGRSLYSGRDFFYPVKFYSAKKIVKAVQEKKKSLSRLSGEEFEPETTFPSQEDFFYQSYSGCDQKGNSLRLKFTLRPGKIADIILILKLANGPIYTFPGHQNIFISSIKENKWKINGLIIENLEPYKRSRIVFNGLLQNKSCKTEKIEHVQFNFIFNCCSAPQFYPENCDTSLLAESLATRAWKDGSWKQFLFQVNHKIEFFHEITKDVATIPYRQFYSVGTNDPDGYEQFGSLFGFVKGDSFQDEHVLNLPACRSKYWGPDERFHLKSAMKIFLVDENGVLIHVSLKTCWEEESQLSYGYICHKKFDTVPIIDQDMRLKMLGKDVSSLDLFLAHIECESDGYTCVLEINKSATLSQKSRMGFDVSNFYAECIVNTSEGKALIEYQCYENAEADFSILKPILTEKKVNVLPKNFVVDIKSNEANILEITGGKGNSLALLSSLGSNKFFIPDGIIVTVNAFKRHLSENKALQEAIENIDNAFCGRSEENREKVCMYAMELISNEPVHPEVAKDIIKSMEDLKKRSTKLTEVASWAVRSSAIGEDSEELSAAGQNQTILGLVSENEILMGVAQCWASLFTYQSVQYRWQHGMPIKSDMAVVIQKMVPAEAAGVLFTWHPTTSNPSQMVINSNFGLGESVVSGNSDSDTYILKRTYDGQVSLLEKTLGSKGMVITLTDYGIKELNTSEEGNFEINNRKIANSSSLADEQILQLGRIGVILEEAFGEPRDIEWAFYHGDLYLLQSRPITTLHSWTEFELTHELDSPVVTENSLYTMANCGEVFPVAVTALTRTSTMQFLDQGMQRYIDGKINPYMLINVSIFQHRLMLDCILTVFSEERLEEIQMATRVVDVAIFGHPVINKRINSIVRSRLGPPERMKGPKVFFKKWNDARKTKQAAENAAYFMKNANFSINEDDNLKTIYNKILLFEDMNLIPAFSHTHTTGASVFWQILCIMVLVNKEKELKPEHFEDFTNILQTSGEDVESAEVPVYLEKIAKIVKDEGYADEFYAVQPKFGVEFLQSKCPSAYKLFEEFLQRHGHRCVAEFELMEEPWGLNSANVISKIQVNAKHLREHAKENKPIQQVINELVTPVNSVQKMIIKYFLSHMRVAVGKREQTKSVLILAVHKTRMAYRKLAKEMVLNGLLPSEDLIFHLTCYEIGQLIKRRQPQLVNKAMQRQRLYTKWNKLKFPELNYGIPEPEKEYAVPIELLPGTKCKGTPVCIGDVQARACVITHLDEIGTLEKGDILITYSTDIGWSPYFPMLSGVVTELGGLVSHGAVVAREYGLPCIVGVKNVTKMFKTGDIVFLSGKTGELGKV